MLPHNILDRRWQKLTNAMTYHGRDYPVGVDYSTKYPEVALVPENTVNSIITYKNSICARHGILEIIATDNMPVDIPEFNDFAYGWAIKTTAPSPTYTRSNGQAERCVQTLKVIFRKTDEYVRDPYIALLEYGNT